MSEVLDGLVDEAGTAAVTAEVGSDFLLPERRALFIEGCAKVIPSVTRQLARICLQKRALAGLCCLEQVGWFSGEKHILPSNENDSY